MKSLVPSLLFFALVAASSHASGQSPIVITGATLIDGTGAQPIRDAVLTIQGGRIARIGTTASITIPRDARVINAAGKFVLPGLIDTHVHLEMVGLSDIGELPAGWNAPAKLRELVALNARLDLIGGVTTVRDLGSSGVVLDVRNDINAGALPGPRIVAAAMQLVKKAVDVPPERSFLEYDGVDSARSKVRYLVSMGADVIKIRLTHMRPVPTLDEVRAMVLEAHRFHRRATVHTDVPADDLVRLAIDAGVDGIEHNAPLRSQDDQMLVRMAARKISLMAGSGAFYVQRIDSTNLIGAFDQAQRQLFPGDVLSALHAGIDTLHRQTEQMKLSGWSASQRQERFIQELQRARKAGVLLVFGTDCGAYGMIHGEQYKALYGESQLGSTPMGAILMATRDAATALGSQDSLGTIQEGKCADLIIVDADPLADLRNLRQVFRVIKAGIVYDPVELSSPLLK